ncbi:MAG: hypothetical protein ACW98U_11830 [Candidatus Thorarchaeota archaeon]|jgi:hypothetical protein
MSRTDLFAKYTQIYARAREREIVPDGTFVRQLADVPRRSYDIGVFFKAKNRSRIVQLHLGKAIPVEVGKQDGFLETEDSTYLSRTILSKFKTIDFLRVVFSAGKVLSGKDERVEFLKTTQRIIDVILRKARNILHLGELAPFRFDTRVKTLSEFLKKDLKLDEVSVEAASIPFNVAGPSYILLGDGCIITIGDRPNVPQAEFFLVGGIGYRFDKTEGAISEERLFRSTTDLSSQGIDEAYIDGMIQRVTEDFQNRLHSLIFADVWKKSKSAPVGVNFGGDLLIKADPSSEIWEGVFEVYVKSPKA